MNLTANPLDHLRALSSVLEELSANGIMLDSHEYHANAFGSFVLVLARGQERARFIWDGKELILTVEYQDARKSAAVGEAWKHDAHIQVPKREDVFAEIGSNALTMLV